MRLNLGCGWDIREGWWNGDINPVSACVHEFRLGLVADWSFLGNSVDEILLCHVAEHLTAHELGVVMHQSYRVLRRGGKLEMRTPFYRCFDQLADPSHVTAFELRTWKHVHLFEPGFKMSLKLEASPEPLSLGMEPLVIPEWVWVKGVGPYGWLGRALTWLIVTKGLRFVQEWVPRGIQLQWVAVFTK